MFQVNYSIAWKELFCGETGKMLLDLSLKWDLNVKGISFNKWFMCSRGMCKSDKLLAVLRRNGRIFK